jgi:hypothetical protein
MTRTYWHIAHNTYRDGDDLLCRDYLARDGRAPEWKWDDVDEGFDGNVVCLFPDTPRGRTEADWLWYEYQDFVLVRVEVPDELAYLVGEVEEGYPAVDHQIPAEWCTTIRRGYADVITKEGDEY